MQKTAEKADILSEIKIHPVWLKVKVLQEMSIMGRSSQCENGRVFLLLKRGKMKENLHKLCFFKW